MQNTDRREFLRQSAMTLATVGAAAIASPWATGEASEAKRPKNILLITADDMNYNAPGAFGGKTPDITPNIDRLAREGLRLAHAHVTIAVCQPSRQVLMTGRYPHRNGALGFEPIDTSVPTLQESLHKAGFLNGILGKVGHLAPKAKFCWDMDVDQPLLGAGRSPDLYYRHTKSFIERAAKEEKPFFLMANSHDPHRPFHGSPGSDNLLKKNAEKTGLAGATPSRVYTPDEVAVPDFLPDLPKVREEIAQYYSSVRRCDDTVGAILRALSEAGAEEETLVMFLSDNGMAFPFAKTNCYLNSTQTPWLVRWPGVVRAGSVDSEHFVSGIDYMPTILDALGLAMPPAMDGESFLALLRGEPQTGRERVFTEFHKTSGKGEFEMRCVQDKAFGYIYNAWSDGTKIFKNESQGGLTFKAMQEAAKTDKRIAERVRLFQYRVPEEFYAFGVDPDALENLIDAPEQQKRIQDSRRKLLARMEKTGDPLLDPFTAVCARYREFDNPA